MYENMIQLLSSRFEGEGLLLALLYKSPTIIIYALPVFLFLKKISRNLDNINLFLYIRFPDRKISFRRYVNGVIVYILPYSILIYLISFAFYFSDFYFSSKYLILYVYFLFHILFFMFLFGFLYILTYSIELSVFGALCIEILEIPIYSFISMDIDFYIPVYFLISIFVLYISYILYKKREIY